LLAEAKLVKDALREVAKDAPIDVKCRFWCSRRVARGRLRGPGSVSGSG
jgi:hypothetical protein